MKVSDNSILFITSSDPEEGAPHQVMASIMMMRNKYTVLCVCKGVSGRILIKTPLGELPVYSIPMDSGKIASLKWQIQLFFALLKLRFSSKNNIFYIQGNVVTPACFLATLGVKRNNLIYHTQDYLEPGRHPFWEYFERCVAKRANTVFVNESNRARFMASSYKLSDMPTVVRTSLPREWPIPTRDEKLRNKILTSIGKSTDPSNTILILHQGSFSEVRCTKQVIFALSKLPKNFVLVFTSIQKTTRSFCDWHKMICSLHLEKRVIYLDNLPFDTLLKHTAVCDLGILLYPNDGIGNYYQAPGRLTEYLRCGLPIVASQFQGLELLFLKHGLGETCNQDDPDDIASVILKISTSLIKNQENIRLQLIKLGCDEFAYESQFDAIKRVIDERLNSVKK